jgi:hypothetical protein
MDHETAEKTEAADRYLLNESSPEECVEFEAHYFDCAICADRIRTGSIFIDTVKNVMRAEAPQRAVVVPADIRRRSFWQAGFSAGWFNPARFSPAWFSPGVLTPSLIALGLTIVVGYQNLVTLPNLEKPQLLSSAVIAPSARDETQTIRIDRTLPRFNLNFMVDSPRLYPNYICEFTNEKGDRILTIESGPRDVSSFTLSLLLSPNRFPSGRYAMTLRPQSDTGAIVQRYTFVIDRGGTDEKTPG